MDVSDSVGSRQSVAAAVIAAHVHIVHSSTYLFISFCNRGHWLWLRLLTGCVFQLHWQQWLSGKFLLKMQYAAASDRKRQQPVTGSYYAWPSKGHIKTWHLYLAPQLRSSDMTNAEALTEARPEAVEWLLERVERAGPAAWLPPALLLVASLPLVRLAVPLETPLHACTPIREVVGTPCEDAAF